MAYMIGTDVKSGRVTVSTPKQNNARPANRSAGRTAPQIPDEEDARGRKAYVDHVYGGLVSNKPEVQKAVSDQYDYNKKRVLSGKDPLKIADVKWDPTAYDDTMNEWMDQRYQKTGKLPSGEERLDYLQEDAAKKRRENFETAGAPQKNDKLLLPIAADTTGYHPIAGGLSALKESAGSPPQPAPLPQNQPTLLQRIDQAAGKAAEAIGYVTNAPQALYLNAWAALLDAAQGRTPHYDAHMNGATYAAHVSDAFGAPQSNIPAALENIYTNPQARKAMAKALGLPLSSEVANVVSTLQGKVAQLPYEILTDPTFVLGSAEAAQLSKTDAVAGKLPGEILAAGRGTGRLPSPLAQTERTSRPAVADDILKGYTEGTGDVGKVITEIKYRPSSGVVFQANPDKTTTLLGSYEKDMKKIVNEMGNMKSAYFGAKKGGFNVLNVPDDMYKNANQFWNEVNKPWLDEVIRRGDDIVLATTPKGKVISHFDKGTQREILTGFGREYQYLLKNGYSYDATTNMMIRK